MNLFAARDLKRLAGRARFERGRDLVDAVDDLHEDEFSLCAYVDDGDSYMAMVHHGDGPLSGECDCPAGAPGSFCEHVVAVGLCYLADDDWR